MNTIRFLGLNALAGLLWPVDKALQGLDYTVDALWEVIVKAQVAVRLYRLDLHNRAND